jgi:hypothetical protein
LARANLAHLWHIDVGAEVIAEVLHGRPNRRITKARAPPVFMYKELSGRSLFLAG